MRVEVVERALPEEDRVGERAEPGLEDAGLPLGSVTVAVSVVASIAWIRFGACSVIV